MAQDGSKPKILIVDDTPENIQVIMETLKDQYAIVAAINGEKALKMAVAEPKPDLILLDIMMPGMDGYEVCRRLKADEQARDIPIIFVTAKTTGGTGAAKTAIPKGSVGKSNICDRKDGTAVLEPGTRATF